MEGKTYIQIPTDLSNPLVMRRTLMAIVEYIDVAYKNRGTSSFVSSLDLSDVDTKLSNLTQQVNYLVTQIGNYVRKDGAITITGALSYDNEIEATQPKHLVTKGYVDSFKSGMEIEEVQPSDDLETTIDKVNEILGVLKSIGIIAD